jgi:hypothetical protein
MSLPSSALTGLEAFGHKLKRHVTNNSTIILHQLILQHRKMTGMSIRQVCESQRGNSVLILNIKLKILTSHKMLVTGLASFSRLDKGVGSEPIQHTI